MHAGQRAALTRCKTVFPLHTINAVLIHTVEITPHDDDCCRRLLMVVEYMRLQNPQYG